MVSHDEKDRNKISDKKARVQSFAIITTLCVFIAAGTLVTYRAVSSRVTQMSMSNLAELVSHDERSVESSIEQKWRTLEGIGRHLAAQNITSTEDLVARLSTNSLFIDCIVLTLVADSGQTVSSNFVIKKDDMMTTLCHDAGDRFARRIRSPRALTQGRVAELAYGVGIKGLAVDGVAYTHLVARLDIDSVQNSMKVDCYDGRGHSRVIDMDGNYIVKADKSHTPQIEDNFFAISETGTPGKGWSNARAKRLMAAKESFTATWRDENGVNNVISIMPMRHTDWYFVTRVPMSVFTEQSVGLVKTVLLFMALAFAGITLAVAMMLRRNFQMIKAEREHHKELAEVLDRADAANRAKTTFLNNMSHDMRTPMNAIIGYTALASAHIDNTARARDYLSKIAQSSDHLLSLINDVLDMSRIEAGKVNIDEKPESLPEILHHLRNIVLADIHSKSLDLFVDTVDVTDENIVCDKLHLNQVLLNLLSNAMKFTKAGGTVSLRVTERPAKNPGRAVYEFRVKDTGIGMSADFLEQIFEPFARERTSTVSGIQGTGLGMSITKNIVDMMGGTITVSSEQGKGTEFVVTLEFALHGEKQEIKVIKALEGSRSLVVDDDLNTCQSVSSMLRQIGMRAEWTMYGKEAVVRTEEAMNLGDSFRVYIIDWLMPDMNGIETTRRIRKIVGDEAPIIVLSAYDWTDIEDEARAAGVTDFVSKPLFSSELRAVLARACGESAPEKIPPKDDSQKYEFHGAKLLLVEDNELNREIAAEILSEANFSVDTATDGTEAVRIMQNAAPGEYSAILMDVQMPLMDGYEATRRIRALPDKIVATTPIIALTANAFDEDKRAALDAGMDAHVEKPVSVPDLMETLKKLVAR